MTLQGNMLVDWDAYAQARSELGTAFVRILGYFQEDGIKSVAAIEAAMRAGNAAALVIPAHTLKGEARQFGAEPLAIAAERIETIARACVEKRDSPDEALAHIVDIRPLLKRRWSCCSVRPIRWWRASRASADAQWAAFDLSADRWPALVLFGLAVELDVIFQPHPGDHVELAFEHVDMFLFTLKD